MRKFKVLYTLNYARIAGTERHLMFLLKNLDRRLFDATVVCFSEGPLIDTLNSHGIQTFCLQRNGLIDYSAAKQLYRLMRANRFDLLHSHCGHFACVIGKLAGVPCTIETRHGLYFNYDELDNVSLMKYLVNRGKAAFVDLTLTVTQVDKKILMEKFRVPNNKVKYIVNGVDIKEMQNLQSNPIQIKKTLRIQSNIKIVGTVARFAEYKGLQYFIESMKIVKEKVPHSKFIMIGDGELKESLITLAKRLGVFQDIIFTGYRDDAVSLMSILDVFVLPSLCEGMPYTVLEAMALRIPVVTTNIFGNREIIIDRESGFLIPPRNSEALAEAVIDLLNSKEKALAIGKNGFDRVKRFFSAKKMAENIEQSYLELFNGKK
jgi:glycosyltransferase involved in cell wall biosynthesis